MAEHKVAAREIGAYEQQLTADAVDTVAFADNLDNVEVISDGTASIFVSVQGTDPTVGGQAFHYLPPFPCRRVVRIPGASPSTVKLISEGTPVYSVARAVED